MLFLRSLIFVSFHALSIVFFAVLSILLWTLPFKYRYKIMRLWAVSNIWMLKVVCGIHYEIKGLENISDTPCIIMCKHQSAWETLALQVIFPQQVWVLKRELLWIPFFGWGLAALNPIAIDRGAGRKALNQVVEQGKERLGSGSWIVIFPEGTRIPSGKVGRFGIGGAKLAVESGYPIIPVAHDAGKAWPRNEFIKKPNVITLVIGDEIATVDKTAAEVNEQVYQWMEGQMTKLEGQKPIKIEKKDKKRG